MSLKNKIQKVSHRQASRDRTGGLTFKDKSDKEGTFLNISSNNRNYRVPSVRVGVNSDKRLVFNYLGNGTISMPNKDEIKIKGTSNAATLTVESIAADADNAAPELILYRNADLTDNGNIGMIRFKALDDGGTDFSYAEIMGEIEDETNVSLKSSLKFIVANGGSAATRMIITGDNIGIGTQTFDGSVAKYLAIKNGTEPSTHTNDQIYIGSKNASSSSESTLSLFLEEDPAESSTFNQTHRLKIWINGDEYYLPLDTV